MAEKKDTYYYRKDPNTGQLSLIKLVRPDMIVRNIGPLKVNQAVSALLQKDGKTVVQYDYTVKEAITKTTLMGVFKLTFDEVSDDITPESGEVITCQDAEEYKKEYGQADPTFDKAMRPRNINRENLGPFEHNSVIHAEVLIDTVSFITLDYTVGEPPAAGKILVAKTVLDFVES